MNELWRRIQAASKICLWSSWATVVWALFSYLSFKLNLPLPNAIDLLTFWSAPLALLGSACAVLYVILGARTTHHVASGLLAAAANLVYAWTFVHRM
jgi:hypothetical protein